VKQQRIYVDTSVLGGCFDPEFERWSNMLLEAFLVRRLAGGRAKVTWWPRARREARFFVTMPSHP